MTTVGVGDDIANEQHDSDGIAEEQHDEPEPQYDFVA